jgi:hypothetical protein
LVAHFPAADEGQLGRIAASFNAGVRHQLTVVIPIVNDDLVMGSVIKELYHVLNDENMTECP